MRGGARPCTLPGCTLLPVLACLVLAQSSGCRVEVGNLEAQAGPPAQLPRDERVSQFSTIEQRVIELTNEFRRQHGREPLHGNDTLNQAARYFANYMARTNRYGHTADDKQPWERAKEHGYDYCLIAENIAYQWRSAGFPATELAQRFVTGWEESPVHRENLLNPHFTETGVALAQGDSGIYFAVQMFGRPKSMAIEFKVANQADVAVGYTVGDDAFDLPPRFTRTHQVCTPAGLTFQLVGNQQPTSSDSSSFTPSHGDSFVVRSRPDGHLQVAKE